MLFFWYKMGSIDGWAHCKYPHLHNNKNNYYTAGYEVFWPCRLTESAQLLSSRPTLTISDIVNPLPGGPGSLSFTRWSRKHILYQGFQEAYPLLGGGGVQETNPLPGVHKPYPLPCGSGSFSSTRVSINLIIYHMVKEAYTLLGVHKPYPLPYGPGSLYPTGGS